jgi:hypothetical protein
LAVVVWLAVTAGLFGLDCALHVAFARTIEGVEGGTSSLADYRDLRAYVVSLAIVLVIVVLLAVYRLHRWSWGRGVRAAWHGRDTELRWLAPGVMLVLLPVAVLLAVVGWWGLPFAGPGGQAVAGTQQALAGASGGAAVVALCAAGAVIVRRR